MFNLFNRLNNEKGFTLVELMVVVVIIGILVAIIIPIYGRVQDNAAMKAHEANLRTIDGAISMYIAQEGQDPADINALITAKFLTDEPEIPKRIKGGEDGNADKFLKQTYPADGKYYLEESTKSDGQLKAFPAPQDKDPKDPTKDGTYKDAYRAGDTY